jgi:hypothetical protein
MKASEVSAPHTLHRREPGGSGIAVTASNFPPDCPSFSASNGWRTNFFAPDAIFSLRPGLRPSSMASCMKHNDFLPPLSV